MTCLCHTRYVDTGLMPVSSFTKKENIEIHTHKCDECNFEYRIEIADYDKVKMVKLVFGCLCGKNGDNNYSENLRKI